MKYTRFFTLFLTLCLFLAGEAPFAHALTAPSVKAEAIVLADMDSGNILYEKNMHTRRPPASLTKIMTGLLAVEAVERGEIAMDTRIVAPSDCWTGLDSDSSNAEISPGEEMDFGDYLYCAMVKSANEACNVIATAVAGNIQNFINRMNTRAAELGAKNTYFSDTNGLSDTGHYTTAYDLFLISREAMNHPLFVEISDTLSYEIAPTNIHKQTRVLKNSTALLTRDGGYGEKHVYHGASGVKTGYTGAAGYCLVSTAEKNDMHLLAVVLGCDGLLNTGVETYGNFSGTINLYNWGFRNFSYRTVLSLGEVLTQAPVQYAVGNTPALLRSTEEITLLLPKDISRDDIQITPEVNYKELSAPIPAGTVLGTAQVTISGQPYTTVRLATAEAVELDKEAYYKAKLQETLRIPWVKPALALLALIILVLLFSTLRFRAMRRRHLMERLEAEEQRQLQKQREESLAKSREVQEDMMRFRETLPEAEKKASPPAERYRVTGAASEDGESETDDSIALLFESEDK